MPCTNRRPLRRRFCFTERQLLHEMIETYQGLKMMSRIVKWFTFIVFMFVIDFARLMDALESIFSYLKKWITKS
ncbi:hypothetical protein [Bartonella silvatica]|uniref:hypothetical protein n=1 Tax=Bartonella silvatica TaxID=357760 RepID=UPI00339966AC